jgi:hypothetical protein
MAIKKRLDKRRAAISQHEAAWLRGERDCGFVEFKRDEQLQGLWDRAGDDENFHWEIGMDYPEPR